MDGINGRHYWLALMDFRLMCRELLCRDSGITVSLINYCSNTFASRCEVSIEIST
jgi:hypothetical protein